MNVLKIWLDKHPKDPKNPWRGSLDGVTLCNKVIVPSGLYTISVVNGKVVSGLLPDFDEVEAPHEFSSLEDAKLAIEAKLLQQQIEKSIQQRFKLLQK